MSFLDNYGKRNHLPMFFIILMKRMTLTSYEDFAYLTPRRRDKVLAKFAMQFRDAAANKKDPLHKYIKQHLIENFGGVEYAKNYVATLGVEHKLDGKFFLNK